MSESNDDGCGGCLLLVLAALMLLCLFAQCNTVDRIERKVDEILQQAK